MTLQQQLFKSFLIIALQAFHYCTQSRAWVLDCSSLMARCYQKQLYNIHLHHASLNDHHYCSRRSVGSNADYSTLGSRMSTFSNRGGLNYAQNPAMTMTLNKKASQGYQRKLNRQEAANDPQDYWTQQDMPVHARSKTGLVDPSFINNKMEEDQRTASQVDNLKTKVQLASAMGFEQ